MSLRPLLQAGAAEVMPGVANALAARLAEAAGHRMLFLSGAAVANSHLGVPDLGLVSVTELAATVGAIREAVSAPLLVDADTGFGNALNVRRTVQLLERAGANALLIEDQTFPKRCGHFNDQRVVPKAEMVSKIQAAVDARRSADTLILARTDARAAEGFEAALDRARAYQQAGADFLFVEAPLTEAELLAIPKEVPGLHLCNLVVGGKTPLLPRERLAEAGYAVVLYANAGLQAAMRAMQLAYGHLKQHGSMAGAEDLLMGFAERQQVLDMAGFQELERRYGV